MPGEPSDWHITVDGVPLCNVFSLPWVRDAVNGPSGIHVYRTLTEPSCSGHKSRMDAELAVIVLKHHFPDHTICVVDGPCSYDPYWQNREEEET